MMKPWPRVVVLWLACAQAFALSGCSNRTLNLASSAVSRDASSPRDAAVVVPSEAAVVIGDAQPPFVRDDAGFTLCGNHRCACTNGTDDDTDGAIDGFDPECTGPYDDDEQTFATGVHSAGQQQRCQDCFFDGNSGPGDDKCQVATSCGVDGTPSGGNGACSTCEPSATCVNNCLPRTPNGCDCFGCCDVQRPSGVISILMNDQCSLADLENVMKCPRCVPQPSCKNACGHCELCPGQTEAQLPADCTEYTCDSAEVCGPTRPCANDGYCQLGCCVPVII